MNENNQIIKIGEVAKITQLSKASIYRIKGFPRPIKLGERSSGWIKAEVMDFIKQRMEAR